MLWFVPEPTTAALVASFYPVGGVVVELHLLSASCCGSERKLYDDDALWAPFSLLKASKVNLVLPVR